jgi:alpha-D-xyloside xylohydrolase
MSGIPYWNSDIGGFFLSDYDGKTANRAYLELYTRWFQYATFTPMQRSHGSDVKKEIYNLGKRGDWVFDSEELYINLRYRLLPYIYSTAWKVTVSSGSFLRPLFMDFAADKITHNTGDEYMFGSAFLVAPVTEHFYVTSSEKKWRNPKEDFSRTQIRKVYLPKGTAWFDFWTGERFAGGQTLNRPAPIDIIPLYIRAGSILPIAPKVQYAAEKRWDDLEIRIYSGANGTFTLYEDENDNYNYEKGNYSTIDFIWNDKLKILTISEIKGKFAGMLETRKFRIVIVDNTRGFGSGDSEKPNDTVTYRGKEIKCKM